LLRLLPVTNVHPNAEKKLKRAPLLASLANGGTAIAPRWGIYEMVYTAPQWRGYHSLVYLVNPGNPASQPWSKNNARAYMMQFKAL